VVSIIIHGSQTPLSVAAERTGFGILVQTDQSGCHILCEKIMDKNHIIKVGTKGRHVAIPSGWHRVVDGVCQEGDKFLNLMTMRFCIIDDDDIGCSAIPEDTFFDVLIRKEKS